MKMDMKAKVATFCRELDEDTLRDLARKQKKEELLQRAEDALKAGQMGPGLEADLDALDAMVRQEYGQGLFLVTRGFGPLPPTRVTLVRNGGPAPAAAALAAGG